MEVPLIFMQNISQIGLVVLEKSFECFLPYTGMAAILIFGLYFSFSQPLNASYKIWFKLVLEF